MATVPPGDPPGKPARSKAAPPVLRAVKHNRTPTHETKPEKLGATDCPSGTPGCTSKNPCRACGWFPPLEGEGWRTCTPAMVCAGCGWPVDCPQVGLRNPPPCAWHEGGFLAACWRTHSQNPRRTPDGKTFWLHILDGPPRPFFNAAGIKVQPAGGGPYVNSTKDAAMESLDWLSYIWHCYGMSDARGQLGYQALGGVAGAIRRGDNGILKAVRGVLRRSAEHRLLYARLDSDSAKGDLAVVTALLRDVVTSAMRQPMGAFSTDEWVSGALCNAIRFIHPPGDPIAAAFHHPPEGGRPQFEREFSKAVAKRRKDQTYEDAVVRFALRCLGFSETKALNTVGRDARRRPRTPTKG